MNNKPLGLYTGDKFEYFVKVSMFRFKFHTKADAINFCMKHQLLFDRIKTFTYGEVIIFTEDMIFWLENKLKIIKNGEIIDYEH